MSNASAAASMGRPSETRPLGEGWSIAFGALMLVAGLLASASLMSATFFTVLYIAAMMIVAGVSQFVLAFSIGGWRGKLLWAVGGLFYTIAGALAVADPLLAGAGISLAVGALVAVAGIARIASAFSARGSEHRVATIAAGIVTLIAGLAVLATWPLVSLWLLGAILSVDLIVQGLVTIGRGITTLRTAPPAPGARIG